MRRVYKPSAGGIHPREASRYIASSAGEALKTCLGDAGIGPGEVSVVAFSRGPGLGPCLRTGATLARALASFLRVPLVGVNHGVAHIEAGRRYGGAVDPVVLYVSGGTTQVIAFVKGLYRILGETEDIAVGNFLDAFAREAGLGFPGGPIVQELAAKGRSLVDLPYTVKGMNISLSGPLTRLKALLKTCTLEDLCFSVQETVFSMLVEVSERAMALLGKEELLLTGGVACNTRLREMCAEMSRQRGAAFNTLEPRLCVDNGVMIAWTGLLAYGAGQRLEPSESYVLPRWRVDKMDIPWRQE